MIRLRSERASSEIMGQVFILGLTVTGIGTVILLGMPFIYSLQDMVNTNTAEQSLVLFDSYASRAILGDSPMQAMDINLGGGTLAVEPNSTDKKSYIVVNSSNFNISIPMGKVTYYLGDRILSFEGGGTWLKYPSGSSVMLSPPKFQFNGMALTLPVINISGNSSATGRGVVSVSFKKNATQVLYPDAGILNRANPITNSVYVNITSDFYDAWAEYAKTLGYAKISTDPATRTASIQLSVTPATLGGNTSITNPVNLRGLNSSDPTPLDNFSFRLVPYKDEFDWDIRAISGTKKLIFHVNGNANHTGNPVDINVSYQDDGSGYNKPAEIWNGHEKLSMQGQDGNLYLNANLLGTGIDLMYDNHTDVGAGVYRISSSSFNATGFSWTDNTIQYTIQNTTQYKWSFNNSDDTWKSNFTSYNGSATMGLNATDGNMSGSIYSKLLGDTYLNRTATTTWISPNISWINGTPVSASLYFDWKVATYSTANPGYFYVILVKPNGTSQIYPTTMFNTTADWSNKSNTTISVDDFSQSGNYSLKLVAILNTKTIGTYYPTEEIRWDNPTITLTTITYGNSGSSQLTNKSLFDITQHYMRLMAKDRDISFYQDYVPGKQPAAESTMLMNYSSTMAPIYLYISQNNADVNIRA